MLLHTCPSVALCQYMIFWSATYNIMEQYNGKMERMLPACCDMCPSVALCQLLLNLWSATAISAQATSAKQNSKKKQTSRTNPIRIYLCYIWQTVQNQDSIQFFWAISSNVTQIPANCCSSLVQSVQRAHMAYIIWWELFKNRALWWDLLLRYYQSTGPGKKHTR